MPKKDLINHDDRIAASPPAVSDGPAFDPASLITAPVTLLEPKKQSRIKLFLKAAAGRSMGSLFWYLFFNVIFNWGVLFWGIGVLAAGIAAGLGWKVFAPEEEKKKADTVVQKLQKAKEHVIPAGVIPAAAAVPVAALIAQADVKKSELELKIREEKRLADERREEERKRREREERDALAVRAAALKLEVEDDWSNARIEAEIEEAEEREIHDDERAEYERKLAEYKELLRRGPNARCPRCRDELRITDAQSKRSVQCKACNYIFGGSRGRANWTPPPPPKPPSGHRGLLGRIHK